MGRGRARAVLTLGACLPPGLQKKKRKKNPTALRLACERAQLLSAELPHHNLHQLTLPGNETGAITQESGWSWKKNVVL